MQVKKITDASTEKMDNFPLAKSFLNKSLFQNDNVKALLSQFEEALDENQKLKQKLRTIRPQAKELIFEANMCDHVANVSKTGRENTSEASIYVDACYTKIVQVEQLMDEVELKNVLSYAVKCKEEETLREINMIKQSSMEEAKQLDILENRSVVKNLREQQMLQEKSQKELEVLEMEMKDARLRMMKKIKRAKAYRDKKIISLARICKLIEPLEKKLLGISPSPPDSTGETLPAFKPNGSPNVPVLQSSLDFLSHFLDSKCEDEKSRDEADEVEVEGQSEQMACSPSPVKKVRFKPSPNLTSVHIVERLSSMWTDWCGSVGTESAESSANTATKSHDLETEERYKDMPDFGFEEDDFPADETKQMKFESAVDEDEATLVESDEEESSGGELSPVQAEKPEEQLNSSGKDEEESDELEEMVVEKEEKSAKKQKVEVLNVVIIPPAEPTKDNEVPSIPKRGRFNLKSSSDDMNAFNSLALQFTEKIAIQGEDECEKMEEGVDKAPPLAVSPPSSDRAADSMLNFGEPTYEFNENFWSSNTDNDDPNNQFYDL